MNQMFDVVSEVEKYHQFVPYCKKSVVTARRPGFLKVSDWLWSYEDGWRLQKLLGDLMNENEKTVNNKEDIE